MPQNPEQWAGGCCFLTKARIPGSNTHTHTHTKLPKNEKGWGQVLVKNVHLEEGRKHCLYPISTSVAEITSSLPTFPAQKTGWIFNKPVGIGKFHHCVKQSKFLPLLCLTPLTQYSTS